MRIIDGHQDILSRLAKKDYCFTSSSYNKNQHIDLLKLKKTNISLAAFAIFVKPEYNIKKMFNQFFLQMDIFFRLINSCKELSHIKNYTDIINALSNNKIGVLLAVEGGDCILNVNMLRIFYNLGIRLFTITWNYSNHLADGICSDTNMGLTKKGIDFVREMNKLGMIIDVSHISKQSFQDIINISKDPVVASHSNANKICNHPRNLSDKQIINIAKSKGIIGINFNPPFLNSENKAKINDIIKHINYIKELTNIKTIGLGTDFAGINKTPINLKNIAALPKLISSLKKNNFTNKEIQHICNKNWLRLFKKILGE